MVDVNNLAVFLAAVGAMFVGFLWYGPILGKLWMKEKGYTKESLEKEKDKMGKSYAASFVVALIMAYVLAHVAELSFSFYGTSSLVAGVSSAFWMWLGFIMPVQATATIFGDKNKTLLLIDTSHQLATVLVMGLIIGLL